MAWRRAREGDAALQNVAPESGQTPWKRQKRRGPFAGDVAFAGLRNKLALAPQRLPGPPPSPSTGVKDRLVLRLAGVAVVTTFGVIGFQLGSGPPASPQLARHSSQSDRPRSASEQRAPAAHLLRSAALPSASPTVAKAIAPQSNEQESRDAASSRAVSGRLTVGAVQPQQADEAARLTVSAADTSPGATVMIDGLAPGSTLSTGTQVGPNAWRLPVEELAGAAITPPRGFVGAADLALELRLADNTTADRKGLRLEWSGNRAPAPARSQPRQLDAGEIALMVKTAAEYMANGSVGAARMMLQPAAEAGDPVAAFALAETYDPVVLMKLNAKGGITADVGLAQAWYQKARDFGSAVAPGRIERLARLPE
jgi:hypothetical protein